MARADASEREKARARESMRRMRQRRQVELGRRSQAWDGFRISDASGLTELQIEPMRRLGWIGRDDRKKVA